MTFAVVVPTLNEEASLPFTLAHTALLGFEHIIVVDGGSADRTPEIVSSLAQELRTRGSSQSSLSPQSHAPRLVRRSFSEGGSLGEGGSALSPSPSITLISSPPGRARQMNRGASASQEDVLLFLHADTSLPLDARAALEEALADQTQVGGRFDVRFERDVGWGWLVSRMVNLRSRLSGIATGDQGIFVRRSVFEQMGGFADIPLMEDVEFTRRLKSMGRVAALRSQVHTSFRRWQSRGPLRTIVLMWTLRFLYRLGVSPHRLAELYTPGR